MLVKTEMGICHCQKRGFINISYHDHNDHSIEDHLDLNCWQQCWCATKGLPVWHFLKRGLSLLLYANIIIILLSVIIIIDLIIEIGTAKYNCELVNVKARYHLWHISQCDSLIASHKNVEMYEINQNIYCLYKLQVQVFTINGTPSQMSWVNIWMLQWYRGCNLTGTPVQVLNV